MKIVRLIIGFSLCLVLLAGCATINEKSKMNNFVRTAEGYSKAITWSEFEAAAQFRKSDGSDDFMKDLEKLEGVRVTNYVVKSYSTMNEDNEVEQIVEIKYYRVNQMIHRKKLILEKWEFNKEEDQWYIKSRLPDLP